MHVSTAAADLTFDGKHLRDSAGAIVVLNRWVEKLGARVVWALRFDSPPRHTDRMAWGVFRAPPLTHADHLERCFAAAELEIRRVVIAKRSPAAETGPNV